MDEENHNQESGGEENPEEQAPAKKKFWKFWALIILINLGFIAVLTKLFIIQVIDAEEYRSKARRQHESKISLYSDRGDILDRNGTLLATSIPSVSIALDPKMLEKPSVIAKELERSLAIPASKIMNMLKKAKGRFLWVAREINPSRIDSLSKIKDKGLILIPEPRRELLYRSIAAQVIGFTNIDNKGVSGIELAWDSVLSGKDGFMIMQRDALGKIKPISDLPNSPKIDGNCLKLTLDIEIQKIVEYELLRGIEYAKAQSGSIAIMDVTSGEIIAMASYPTFDPLVRSSNSGLKNRTITDTYEPGSTFKLITAAAALEANVVSTDEILNGYHGELRFTDYRITDDHPIGKVTFREAFEESSNIIFSTVAHSVPTDVLYKTIRDFGFGLTHDIDLPGEVSGKILKPNQFTGVAKRFMGFGYGISVTPLQMLSAYATVANGGIMMKPHFVKEIYDENSILIKKIEPQKIRKVLTKRTCDTLISLLASAVEKGTGKKAKIAGINIAGKTGTAQQLVAGRYSKSDYNASFTGFFPAGNPRYAMLVLFSKPRTSYYGGSVAAPVFREIALSIIASKPALTSSGMNSEQLAKMYRDSTETPLLKGLSSEEAEIAAQAVGLRITAAPGNNVISNQEPAPGTLIAKGSSVKIYPLSKFVKDTLQKNFSAAKKILNVKGLPSKMALNILHGAGVKVKISGKGKVRRQYWKKEKNDKYICTLVCR